MTSPGRRPLVTALVASAAACATLALFPKEAKAGNQFDLGIDGEGTALLSPTSTQVITPSTLGLGFKIRAGERFNLRRNFIHITPEVGYAFDHLFAGGAPQAVPGSAAALQTDGVWNMNRIYGGVRLGFGHRIQPTFYTHLGYAFRSVSDAQQSAVLLPTDSGLTWDAGVALDFHLLPHLSLGPHFDYTLVDMSAPGQAVPQWLTFGAHVDFLF